MAEKPEIPGTFPRREYQQNKALSRAAAARKARIALKAQMRRGEIDPFALLRGEYEEHEKGLRTWRLEDIVKAIPGIGPATAHEIFELMPASPAQRMHSLTMERRDRLARLCMVGARRSRAVPGRLDKKSER